MNPFSKGVLGFDDFSYKVFNEAIMEQIEVPVSPPAVEDVETPQEGPQRMGSTITLDKIRDFEDIS